jgi:hypothetical protein
MTPRRNRELTEAELDAVSGGNLTIAANKAAERIDYYIRG